MSGRSSRKLSPESSKAKTRYDDSFLDLLESTITDCDGRDRGRRPDSNEDRGHSNRRSPTRRRKRSSERKRSRSRSHPRTRSPLRKKKPTFLEEIQEKYPDIRSEIEERTIENNMKALQMFGVMNQQCVNVVEPNLQFYPTFPHQEQFNMPMRPEFYPVNRVPMALIDVPMLPVEPVPAPMIIDNNIRPIHASICMNPEPPGSTDYSPPKTEEKRETPEIDMQSATKKAFEEGNIGLSDFLRSKVLENKKKMEVTNIQVKKRQVLERCKRALQMIEDVQKGKIILPLFFKPPSKDLPSLKQNKHLTKRSPLVLSDTNMKFAWQENSLDAFLSNPCSNVTGDLMTLARNVPMDLSELSLRAKTRAKIEKNMKAQAAKNIVAAPIVMPNTVIKRCNQGAQTEPLICISCDVRAKTLITTQGTQTEEPFETTERAVEPGTFKFELNSRELGLINNEQRYAISDFCKAFNISCESFLDMEPLQQRRSPSYHARNSSPPRNSRSPIRRPIHDQQHNELMAQNSQFIDFEENNYVYRDRSGSSSPRRRHNAFQRLGQKVPSESPRNVNQRFYEENVVTMMVQNDRFSVPGDHEHRASPLARHLTRSRSPPIFRRLEPLLSPTVPPMNRFEASPRNTSRDFISPPRTEYVFENEDEYRDDYTLGDAHRARHSPIRLLNGSPLRTRNLSPPRNRSPMRNEYRHLKRHDLSPHDSRHASFRKEQRSRSPSPRATLNWFNNSRQDFGSSSGRLSSRRGRY